MCIYIGRDEEERGKKRWVHIDKLQTLKRKGVIAKVSFALRFFSIFRLQSLLI
jgi:hypothetical protein